MPRLTPLSRASAAAEPSTHTDIVSRIPSGALGGAEPCSGLGLPPRAASKSSWWTRLVGGARLAPLPTEPCVAIAPGRKISTNPIELPQLAHSYDDLDDDLDEADFSFIRTSKLLGTRLPPLLISQTLERGAYGKFRLGVDASGQAFAIKEFRTTQWQRTGFYIGPAKIPKTHSMERDAICREAQHSARAKGALHFYDLTDVNNKVYGVLPYCSGSDLFMLTDALNQTHRGLGANNRGVASLMSFVAHAVASTLQDFHAKGFVHKDVRLENILWDATGKVVLSDFGKAEAIDVDGGVSQVPFSAQFSHLAPECLQDDEPLTAKIDIWSLGVSLMDLWLAGDHGDSNPFTQAKYLYDQFVHQRVAQRETIVQWGLFYHAYCQNKAMVSDPTLQHLSMYPYFEGLFAHMEAEDAELSAFIITRMLTPRASERADADEVVAFMQDHLNTARRGVAQYILKRCGRSRHYLQRDRAVLAALRRNARAELE